MAEQSIEELAAEKDPPVDSLRARWAEPLQPLIVPQCHRCKHYFFGTLSCEAFFPIDIPQEIMSNSVMHDAEYMGDEGVLFEAGKPVGAPD